jgi:hypothetical protein
MMFRSTPVDVATAHEVVVPEENVIALSVLQLDLQQPPEGWAAYLGRRGITLRPDDIGRDSIRRSDAQMLLHEQRASELRAVQLRQLAEAEAVEDDKRRRALIWKGVSATALPEGVSASSVMLQAAKDSEPRRTTPLEHALSNSGGMTYHAYGPAEDES